MEAAYRHADGQMVAGKLPILAELADEIRRIGYLWIFFLIVQIVGICGICRSAEASEGDE